MADDSKLRDADILQRQLNLDELAAAQTSLARRAEILTALKDKFDTILASQLSHSQLTSVLPALCEVSSWRHASLLEGMHTEVSA
jgi:hypothetical protein